MPSPAGSPSAAGGKRKRNSAAATAATAAALTPDQQQLDHEHNQSSSPSHHRRTRHHTHHNGHGHARPDQDESRDAPPSKRLRSATAADGHHTGEAAESSDDEHDNRASLMPPPPLGKLTDPIGGYKTNPPPTDRPVRVYADGVFDLFHLGHMRQLEQAKKAFPEVHLIVGVTGDEETHKRKGLTVLSGKQRAETVRHCKWVDEVVENCPWIVTPGFLEDHQIDYVAHDDIPYGADEGDDIYQPIKAAGKFLVTQRTEGVSTTGIITKIVRDYEKYIARQLKRGASRQELNVSWLKKNELELKRHVQDLRDNIRSNWTTTGQELSRELRQFWPSSRPQSPAPRPSLQLASPPSSLAHNSGGGSSNLAVDFTPSSPTPNPAGGTSLSAPHSVGTATPRSPIGSTNDFVAGYAVGLIGGVRSWMTKSRRRSQDSRSRQVSDDDEEDMEAGGSSSHPHQHHGHDHDGHDDHEAGRDGHHGHGRHGGKGKGASRVSSSSDLRRSVRAA